MGYTRPNRRPPDYDNAHPEIHAAPFWLAADAPDKARSAIEKIPSWRRIPAPLAWMTEIGIKHGTPETWWPLLAELAWVAPERLESLIVAAPVAVNRLKTHFLADFENNGEHHDLAWFPAWLLIHHSELRDLLRPAQPAQNNRHRHSTFYLTCCIWKKPASKQLRFRNAQNSAPSPPTFLPISCAAAKPTCHR